jgi:hypothetical protein
MAEEALAATPLSSPSDIKNRKCGTCGRILATETHGILAPANTTWAACDTCDEFESLYAAIGPVDQAFEAIKHRSVKYLPRWNALKAAEKAHLALANFLIRVEDDRANASTEELAAADEDQPGDHKQGTKRPRSSTSTLGTPHSSKRFRLDSGLRGIRFDDSVIVRDASEYRDAGKFQRDTAVYVRGRNAAPEGAEWVDASGSSKTYGKFHGLKWRGRKWANDPKVNMDSMEDNEASESELQPAVSEDDENAGSLEEEEEEEEEETNKKNHNPEEGHIKAATKPTQISVRNIESDVPKVSQIDVMEVGKEGAEERKKEHTSLTTFRSKEELMLSEHPTPG